MMLNRGSVGGPPLDQIRANALKAYKRKLKKRKKRPRGKR